MQNHEANLFARLYRGTESRRIGAAAELAAGIDRSVRSRLIQLLAVMVALSVSPLFAQSPSQSSAQQEPTFRRGLGGMPPWAGWGNENDLGGSLVRTEGSGVIDEDVVQTAREVASHSVDRRPGR